VTIRRDMDLDASSRGSAPSNVSHLPLTPRAPASPIQNVPEIPYRFAHTAGLVVAVHGGAIEVALRPNFEARALIELRRFLGTAFSVRQVDDATFNDLLSDRYAIDGAAAEMAGTIADSGTLNLLSLDLPSAEDLLASADDAPAIRLINGIIAEATRKGVSDIHIEPYETGLVVRLRVDGLLKEMLRMPPHVAPMLVSRIKVMARLDIAERRLPQDGRIGLTLAGKQLDVRVSTLPSRAGERVVLRILDGNADAFALSDLGMSAVVERTLRTAIAEPNGIILVTGPTGSGKTTTLYACIRALNDGTRNVLTVEDPVEFVMDGVGQTQVNAKVGLTFAAGLRAILRQDPDIVMVGEIRDHETAEIAVQASLTGHLVLSTVHTNDAIGAITRMRDMKVEPFLLASTLRAVVAQRLIRRLCSSCRAPISADAAVASHLGIVAGTPIFRGVGCSDCHGTGYRGRVGVFEAVRIDETMRRLINENADEDAIADHAYSGGLAMIAGIRDYVRDGVTSAEEVMRVLRPDGMGENV
jgi:general secretion pathway protein E